MLRCLSTQVSPNSREDTDDQPDHTAGPTDRYLERDKVHSTVGFAVPYMAGTFQGTFSDFDARLGDGVLRGTAEVASVQVKDPNLEAHLQSPEFFDAERYPRAQLRGARTSAAPATTSRSPAS